MPFGASVDVTGEHAMRIIPLLSSPPLTKRCTWQVFEAGDVIFREAPLVAGQHTASRAQCLVCARCFRFLGSIEAQLVHRLLIRDEAAGSRLGGPSVDAPHAHSCHSDHAPGSGTPREETTVEAPDTGPELRTEPESCKKPDRTACASATHRSPQGKSRHSCISDTESQPKLQAGSQERTGGSHEADDPLHDHGAQDSCAEDSLPDEMAIQSVQPLLQLLANNTERLPLSEDFLLPSPVKGRSAVSIEGTSGSSSGINSNGFIPDGSSARVFCSSECEKAAWDSSDCVLIGELPHNWGNGADAAALWADADGNQQRRSGFSLSMRFRSASISLIASSFGDYQDQVPGWTLPITGV